jgi:hypothetical protein
MSGGNEMKLSTEDRQLLDELCRQNSVSREKVRKLLETVYDYESKERRTGIYDALREILKSCPPAESDAS